MSYPLNLFRALYAYHHKKTMVKSYPLIKEIETTNKCNLKCVFCPRKEVKERGLGMMNLTTFNNVVNKENARSLRTVCLYMHGEPLLNPDLEVMISRLKQFARNVSITTNGILLTKKRVRSLLSSGIDEICVSFEGITKQIYESLRLGSNYETVIQNIKDFKEENDRFFQTTHKKVVSSLAVVNVSELIYGLNGFLVEMQKYFDRIHLLEPHNWTGKIKDERFKPVDQHRGSCFFPWFSVGIWNNGSVSPCCIYEGCDAGLGNINDEPLIKIWNSQKYQEFRLKMITDRDSLPVCRECTVPHFTDRFLNSIDRPESTFPLSYCGFTFSKDMIMKLVNRVQQ